MPEKLLIVNSSAQLTYWAAATLESYLWTMSFNMPPRFLQAKEGSHPIADLSYITERRAGNIL